MPKLLVEIKIPDYQYCNKRQKCEFLKYDSEFHPCCSLFDNTRLKESHVYDHIYCCTECKEAQARYLLWEQAKGYRSPFYQVED